MGNYVGENLIPVHSLAPAADAGGRTGAYVSIKQTDGPVWVVFYIEQGNAATIACSMKGASDAAGTGAATLTASVPIFTVLDCAASGIPAAQTQAANYTTDAGVKKKFVIFRVDPATVQAQNSDFTHIAAVTGASNAANITSAHVLMGLENARTLVNPGA